MYHIVCIMNEGTDKYIYEHIYILIRYWMVRSLCLSVILSVRYRNHFPVVQFPNQAYIWNPHGKGQVFKTIWGAEGAPKKC